MPVKEVLAGRYAQLTRYDQRGHPWLLENYFLFLFRKSV